MKVKRLHPDAVIPEYAKPGDSGFDLVAVEDVIITPWETVVVPTGLAFEIPEGYEMQIRPRSGVTRKSKIRVQLGTIDAGYRGEVGVIVDNITHPDLKIFSLNENPRVLPMVTQFHKTIDGSVVKRELGFNTTGTYLIRKGDRIAQGVIAPVVKVEFEEAAELSTTERGSGGFGHTGY